VHAAPEGAVLPVDETVILPGFLTGRQTYEPPPEPDPEAEPARHPADGPLPASERGMLIFVASLLGVGTLAVVIVLGLGGFGGPPPKAGAATPPVSAPASSPTASPSPSASPSLSSSASASPPASPSPTVKRSPARKLLGTLGPNDPKAFCAANAAGRVRQKPDRSWYCSGSGDHPDPLPFTSTDLCRWRFLNKTAYAVAANIDDPSTWKCYA
jgi:hypothetical protein